MLEMCYALMGADSDCVCAWERVALGGAVANRQGRKNRRRAGGGVGRLGRTV